MLNKDHARGSVCGWIYRKKRGALTRVVDRGGVHRTQHRVHTPQRHKVRKSWSAREHLNRIRCKRPDLYLLDRCVSHNLRT